VIAVDAALFRPLDAALLVGDARKARSALGFAPATDVAGLTQKLIEAERRRAV
jgi:GDPmannose 4,6-dehydratase